MNQETFQALLDSELIPSCLKIMDAKGLSYSGKEDCLGNFKRCAKLAGTTPEKTWFTYHTKHYDALCSFIRGEYTDSEPIESRIMDLINYLMLFYAMVKEKKNEQIK